MGKSKIMRLLSLIMIIFFMSTLTIKAKDLPPAVDTPAELNQTVDDIPDENIIVNPPISFDLPDYPKGGKKFIGEMKTHKIDEEDTIMDIARIYNLGFVELLIANDQMDSWAPPLGKEIVIPTKHILPRAEQEGIVINLGEMRLFYFKKDGNIETFPIGIGREGLQTPLGKTTIVKRTDGPNWYPTKRMKDANPDLPWRIKSGPANPLGDYALYLGWPEFLIHGTNKPWGIGRRVSSGCIRMYPEAIKALFPIVPIGTKVEVVDQPIKLAWIDNALYMEAHPSRIQSDEIEKEGFITEDFIDTAVTEELKKFIEKTAGEYKNKINWQQVVEILLKRRGYPVKLLTKKENNDSNSK